MNGSGSASTNLKPSLSNSLPLSSSSTFSQSLSGLNSSSSASRITQNERSIFANSPSNNSNDHLNENELLQLQNRIIDDQDSRLDQLSETIQRQKNLGILIGNELDLHVDLLEETENAVWNSH